MVSRSDGQSSLKRRDKKPGEEGQKPINLPCPTLLRKSLCSVDFYLAYYLSVIYIVEIYCVWNFLSWKTKNFNYLKRILYASLEVTIFLKKRNIMCVLLLLFLFFFFLQETLYYLEEHSEFLAYVVTNELSQLCFFGHHRDTFFSPCSLFCCSSQINELWTIPFH